MTLIAEERANPKLLRVRESLEEQVFGLPTEQSRALLQQIKNAISALQPLLAPNGNPRELSWARSWFQAIGLDAINPADLTLFAISWMDQYVAVTKSLRDFKITG